LYHIHNTFKTISKADATLQLAVLAGDFLLFRAFTAAVSLDNTEV
jgi:geranylgeranyl pyrophosphate synthase